jgi:hypothetical protein
MHKVISIKRYLKPESVDPANHQWLIRGSDLELESWDVDYGDEKAIRTVLSGILVDVCPCLFGLVFQVPTSRE